MLTGHRGWFRGGDTLVKSELGAGLFRTFMDSELSFDGGAPPGVRSDQ